jgi:excisionase family DNA binding protein
MKKELLTTKEAAKYLSMSESYLVSHRHYQTGQIPFIRLGWRIRYRRKDLDRIIREGVGKKKTAMKDISDPERFKLPVGKEHPFRQMLKDREICLWQISDALGFSESLLSRQLSGIRPMPEKVETFIRTVLETVDTTGWKRR